MCIAIQNPGKPLILLVYVLYLTMCYMPIVTTNLIILCLSLSELRVCHPEVSDMGGVSHAALPHFWALLPSDLATAIHSVIGGRPHIT